MTDLLTLEPTQTILTGSKKQTLAIWNQQMALLTSPLLKTLFLTAIIMAMFYMLFVITHQKPCAKNLQKTLITGSPKVEGIALTMALF